MRNDPKKYGERWVGREIVLTGKGTTGGNKEILRNKETPTAPCTDIWTPITLHIGDKECGPFMKIWDAMRMIIIGIYQ